MRRWPAWRSNLVFFASLLSYWLLLSFIDRVVFTASVWERFDDKSDVFYAFLHGLVLDMSLSAYLIVIPCLFFAIQQLLIRRPVSRWWLRIYVMIPTFIFAAITVSNLPLYEAWGEKISKRAIVLGLDTVGGVTSSIDLSVLWQTGVVLLVFFACAHYFYHWIVLRYARYHALSKRLAGLSFLLLSICLFTFIRGGYGRATLNQSAVYFSDDNTANHAAVNTYWSLLRDLTKSTKNSPYKFMESKEAASLVLSALGPLEQQSENTLTTDRPNVILVILEGMVAQVFEDLGGEKDVTPRMKMLMDEGVSFRRAYAAADRSDKGMVAVMSGFPAQGPESIIKYIPKHEKLPAIGQIFDSLGYATSFYHGGQSEFYNFKSYMFTHGIERVVDNDDFPLQEMRNSWGVYDHVVTKQMLEDLSQEKKPFFSVFYALVNHEPFHLQPSYKFGHETKANAYRSTSFYTDSMLFNFVEQAKQQAWYNNTIIVVTSDHGHIYPTEKFGLERPERYHIPLFVFGGALKNEFKGRKVDEVVSQLDVATTLAHFVKADATRFTYGRDLFAHRRKHVAFYNSNSTFGIITDNYTVSYDMLKRNVGYSTVPSTHVPERDSLLHMAKGYYQQVFSDFLRY
ncbi:LTA synthase family protein [Sphingobacterium paludis]|uniref:Phosphoglycerol transferase MdoB-like AlkP superfamily enzyme n=1 Tax=Sphingobacterium paludis TaxID=1476465 RepID=A0A4R7CVH8_9SPHI|nr:LTA synthase family protein [Sphingobacterium paludis]TDS12429.1 phosphoglycerol transferase MdoB-like AlkP superfamily enzyme [Sphingobacterium paludis]